MYSRRPIIAALTLLLLTANSAAAQPVRYACTAWGGSHTGRYTFEIDREACTVYWVEISKQLELRLCEPPRIVAIKPFAPAKGYELHFNLTSGVFSDHVPGWADRGSCAPNTDQ